VCISYKGKRLKGKGKGGLLGFPKFSLHKNYLAFIPESSNITLYLETKPMKKYLFRFLAMFFTFLVGIVLVSSYCFPKQNDFNDRSIEIPNETCPIQTNDSKTSDLSITSSEIEDEYAVYSAILNDVKRENKIIVVTDQTTNNFFLNPEYFVKDEVSVGNENLSENAYKVQKIQKLTNNFNSTVTTVMISIKDKEKLLYGNYRKIKNFKKYANAYTFIEFSKVRFNNEHNKAILYYGTTCGPLCGGGNNVFLEKMNGKWIIKHTVGLWVS
jgi:hypothetical protein